MSSETSRISLQLHNAFSGDPWHGSPLSVLLAGVSPEQAAQKPLPGIHSICELGWHIEIYARIGLEAMDGVPMPKLYLTETDWPSAADSASESWQQLSARLFETVTRLSDAITNFPDARLVDTVPGREYDFYHLFHGIVQHSLYHAGQIALLKQLCAASPY